MAQLTLSVMTTGPLMMPPLSAKTWAMPVDRLSRYSEADL